MIDRTLRDRYASALRQLLAGHITNWQFEGITEGEILESEDAVLVPNVAVWPFFEKSEFDGACQSPRFLVGSS
jgi:hypothetical protein